MIASWIAVAFYFLIVGLATLGKLTVSPEFMGWLQVAVAVIILVEVTVVGILPRVRRSNV